VWLDAHSDFHTPLTTTSGNLHGTPLAYIAGRDGFDAFPPFPAPVPAHRICMFGIRSVDPAEQAAMQERDIAINDMRVIDERGIVASRCASSWTAAGKRRACCMSAWMSTSSTRPSPPPLAPPFPAAPPSARRIW
jgi:arginase family enzyme